MDTFIWVGRELRGYTESIPRGERKSKEGADAVPCGIRSIFNQGVSAIDVIEGVIITEVV